MPKRVWLRPFGLGTEQVREALEAHDLGLVFRDSNEPMDRNLDSLTAQRASALGKALDEQRWHGVNLRTVQRSRHGQYWVGGPIKMLRIRSTAP
jgi:hypothetical protein